MTATSDTTIVTGPNFQQSTLGAALVTPTGGAQAALGDALTGKGQTASSLNGWFGATPIVQPTAGAQAQVTDKSGGTASATTGVGATLGVSTILVPVSMVALANAQTFSVDPGFNGKLNSISYRNTVPVTTGAKAATLSAAVNGATLTGGVISLAGAYAVGAAQAGTAITAGTQTFTSAQTIGFAVSSVTTFSEGAGVVELNVTNTDLTNAVATVVAQGNAIDTALVNLGLMKGS